MRFLRTAACFACLCLAACGGGGTVAPTSAAASSTFLYVFDQERAGSARVDAFRVDASNGSLSRAWSGALTEFQSIPWRMAHSSGRFIIFEGFSATRGAGQVVAAYRADRQTGALLLAGMALGRALGGSVGGVSGSAIIGSINGRSANESFVFSVASLPGDMTIHRVDPTRGTVTPLTGSPFPLDFRTYVVVAPPNGRFVYTSTLLGSRPGQSHLYAHAVDPSSGGLTPVAGSPFLGQADGRNPVVHPSGRFFYVEGDIPPPQFDERAERCFCRVLGYAVDSATGALSLVPGAPFTLADPSSGRVLSTAGLDADPLGRFVYVSTQVGLVSYLMAFSIEASSGRLSPASDLMLDPLGFDAFTAVFEPSGRFRYGLRGSILHVDRVDPTTGRLTPAGDMFLDGIPGGNRLLTIQVPD